MTGRIRWEDNEHRWDDDGCLLGYAGTRKDWLFQIFEASDDADDETLALTFSLSGVSAVEIAQGDSPEALKAAAEAWLEEFTSSLGAVFPGKAAADLRAHADEMESYVGGDAEDRHDRSVFATGMRRAADLLEHGGVPAANPEGAGQ